MGRPKPSQQVLDFAAAFACAVTAQSASICDFVARSGDFSLYAVLRRLAPKVLTCDTTKRGGELFVRPDAYTADKDTTGT